MAQCHGYVTPVRLAGQAGNGSPEAGLGCEPQPHHGTGGNRGWNRSGEPDAHLVTHVRSGLGRARGAATPFELTQRDMVFDEALGDQVGPVKMQEIDRGKQF